MGRRSATFQIKGFEELLEDVKKCQGDIEKTVTALANESVDIIYDALKSSANAADVPKSVTNTIQKNHASWHGNVCSASVGWKKEELDPNNPSPGHKAVFLNYGTPRRTEHGKITGHFFITNAKKKASKKVKKAQKDALNNIIGNLK